MEDIIKVENVAKGYAKHQVLQNLDLNIKKGECFTLLGPSGCGKTVLIRLIAGHEVPDAGKISIDNTTVADSSSGEYIPPERRGLGIVFQDYAVWPHMTVYENIAYPLKMEKRPTDGSDTKALAKATRCCCPPLSSEGRRFSKPFMPTISTISITSLLISSLGRFSIFSG